MPSLHVELGDGLVRRRRDWGRGNGVAGGLRHGIVVCHHCVRWERLVRRRLWRQDGAHEPLVRGRVAETVARVRSGQVHMVLRAASRESRGVLAVIASYVGGITNARWSGAAVHAELRLVEPRQSVAQPSRR